MTSWMDTSPLWSTSNILYHILSLCSWSVCKKLLMISQNSGYFTDDLNLKNFMITSAPDLYYKIKSAYKCYFKTHLYRSSKYSLSLFCVSTQVLIDSVFTSHISIKCFCSFLLFGKITNLKAKYFSNLLYKCFKEIFMQIYRIILDAKIFYWFQRLLKFFKSKIYKCNMILFLSNMLSNYLKMKLKVAKNITYLCLLSCLWVSKSISGVLSWSLLCCSSNINISMMLRVEKESYLGNSLLKI